MHLPRAHQAGAGDDGALEHPHGEAQLIGVDARGRLQACQPDEALGHAVAHVAGDLAGDGEAGRCSCEVGGVRANEATGCSAPQPMAR